MKWMSPAFLMLALFVAWNASAAGCAARWRDASGEEFVAGMVMAQVAEDGYRRRVFLGIVVDFVAPSMTIGLQVLEDRVALSTAADPSELFSRGISQASSSSMWYGYGALGQWPVGPRLAKQEVWGLFAGRSLGFGRCLIGQFSEYAFLEIGLDDHLLFMSASDWYDLEHTNAWKWSADP